MKKKAYKYYNPFMSFSISIKQYKCTDTIITIIKQGIKK